MINNLSNAKKDKEFKINPNELSEFGLDEKAIVVNLRLKDGTTDSIRFGDKTPVGAYVFCSKTDSVVFTTNQYIKNSFDKKLYDLRDKKLLHFKRNQVRGLVLRNSHGKFEFIKTEVSDWDIKTINRPADDSKISSIISRLLYNRAKSFVDEEGTQLVKYGLKKPMIQVDVLLGQEEGRRTLYISKKIDGKYYAKDDDRNPIFEVDSLLVRDLNKKLNHYRDPDLADFERSEIDRITISYSDTTFTVVRDSGNVWVLEEEGGEVRKIKSGKISSFLSDLNFTKIAEYVKDGNINKSLYGLDKPSLKISLYNDVKLVIEVMLGKVKGDRIYAMVNKYDSVYLITKRKLKELKLKLDDILEPEEEKKEEDTKTEA